MRRHRHGLCSGVNRYRPFVGNGRERVTGSDLYHLVRCRICGQRAADQELVSDDDAGPRHLADRDDSFVQLFLSG